jgi:hypothetical protein
MIVAEDLKQVPFSSLKKHTPFRISKLSLHQEEKKSHFEYMRCAQDADIGFRTHFKLFQIDPTTLVWVKESV